MTVTKKIMDPLPNEHVVGISPPPEDRQRLGRRRLNMFTGRALSDKNLRLEQTYRATHLALLGQQRSAGVVEGLEAAIAPRPANPAADNPLNDRLIIEKGYGLSRQGEELRVAAQRDVRLGDLPVYAPPEMLNGTDTTPGSGTSPLEPRTLGGSLQTLINPPVTSPVTPPAALPAALPAAGVVLLQPITTESSGANPSNDPCPVDVPGLAFANRQLIDGARLIFYAWPTEWLALPPLETPATDAAGVNRWRSRLAYAIFRRELSEPMPWDELGVPIALLGFDASWQVLFSDRYAVVRQGGRARHRSIPVARAGNPFLWQARIEQFAEQLGELDLSQISAEQLADYFAWLPPVGGLPNYLVENLALPAEAATNPVARRQLFFPTGYRVEAAPIPEEQLDLVFRESAPLLPYDTVSNDASSQVKLLVPVPQKFYDPDLLTFERLDPEFSATLTRFVNRRAEVLHRRQIVRDRASLHHQAITGNPLKYPDPDPDQLETDEKAIPDEPFTSQGAHQSAIAQGVHEHGFSVDTAAATLPIRAGDRLITYAYLDPDYPPAELMLTFQLGNDSEHRAYWSGLNSLIARGTAGTPSRQRMGDRPDLGDWIRLEIPIDAVGLNPGNILTGMVFTLYNGRAAWGHTARVAADGSEQVWVGAALPEGATELETNEPWLWLSATERLTPFEERYSIEGEGDRVVITPLAELKTALINTPIDRYTLRLASDAAEREQVVALLNRIPADSPVKADSARLVMRIQGVLTDTERDRLLALNTSNVPPAIQAVFTEAVVEIFEQSQENTILDLLNVPSNSPEPKGLEVFIKTLEDQISRADDQVEFGFLQVRTDMFRIRQFVLGNEEANRLSVSPTLGAIATRDTAAATQKELSTFYNQIRADIVTLNAETDDDTSDTTDTPVARRAGSGSELSNFELVVNPLSAIAAQPTASTTALRTAFLDPSLVGPQPVRDLGAPFIFRPTGPQLVERVTQLPLAKTLPVSETSKTLEVQAQTTPQLFFQQPPDTILQQSPLIGKVNQSIVIAERLKQRPAPEARDYTVADRASVVNNLAQANLFKDIPIPGTANATFGKFKLRPDININPPEIAPDSDEVEYFSSSVRILDDTVAALRLAEGRIAAYRLAIGRARQTLTQLKNLRQQADRRLGAIGGDLAEARHDVSVARALIAEEQQRLDGINQKRQKILETQVPFLVYHRPRTLGPDTNTPVRSLLPSVSVPSQPACLNRRWPLPEALQEATELLRQSPVSWFTQVIPLIKQLDSPEILYGAIQRAALAALQPKPFFAPALQRYANQSSLFAQAITRTVSAQQQAVSRKQLTVAQLDINQLAVASWQRLRDRAKTVLTLGDLIDGKHARRQLSLNAAKELEDLTRALGCLYAGFSDIRPIIRLAWAERLSQYDTPINLRNFSSLPRWGEIEYLERRELQSVADWLYLRVSPNRPEAIALIDDLVRICILLASAAPVDQIIAGRIVEPTPINKGGKVTIAIDPTKVHIGMNVFLYGANNRIVAKGKVEDLSASQAAARITQTTTTTVQLAANTQVRFLTAASDDTDDTLPEKVPENLTEASPAPITLNNLGITSTLLGNFPNPLF